MKRMILLIGLIAMIVCSASAYRTDNFDFSINGDLITTPTANEAKMDQIEMGYSPSYSQTNAVAYDAYAKFKYDSIFFFNGHGLSYSDGTKGGGIKFSDESWILGKYDNSHNPGSSRYFIDGYNSNDIDDSLLAVYISCYSSYTNQYNGNIASISKDKGVDMSIGFTGEIETNNGKCWSENFWERTKNGETVSNAISNAKDDCFWCIPIGYHGIDTYKAYVENGRNLNVCLTPARQGTI
ncbi:hypothetical protein J2128_001825 [Methanomicrobium sp. W14]|uniref:hypothetical protein n=1 Tax=Methanomicrobium sp. W14 TaxID=2817839 RepID=UPI001AE5A3C5|nr:hypothetical protein [Methanomicrobium sp. W14]MBP2133871.1 hypothetical protein [Methanomicrobium sp. W14]